MAAQWLVRPINLGFASRILHFIHLSGCVFSSKYSIYLSFYAYKTTFKPLGQSNNSSAFYLSD